MFNTVLTFIEKHYANMICKRSDYIPTSDLFHNLNVNNNSNNNDDGENYDALVVNLFQIQLTTPHISLLRKGLKGNNLTKEERTAMKELSSMRSIIIKPADKGRAVVILDRDYYINEGLRQLSDPLIYMEVEEDLIAQHHII